MYITQFLRRIKEYIVKKVLYLKEKIKSFLKKTDKADSKKAEEKIKDPEKFENNKKIEKNKVENTPEEELINDLIIITRISDKFYYNGEALDP